MSEPKRNFWQIHLSTAIFLSISAGGLLLANSLWHSSRSFAAQSGGSAVYNDLKSEVQGWPYPARLRPAGDLPADKYHYHGRVEAGMDIGKVQNLVVAFLILGGIAFACEWLIRRREGRKT